MKDDTQPNPAVDSPSEDRDGAEASRDEAHAERSYVAPTPAERARRWASPPVEPADGPGPAEGAPAESAARTESSVPAGSPVLADIAGDTGNAPISALAVVRSGRRAGRRTPRPRGTSAPRAAKRWGALKIAGRSLAALSAVAVMAGTGALYYAERSVNQGFTRSFAISKQDAAALDGDLNILLIGLDTRKDQNGRDLPKNVLDQLHAGDGQEGGYNANSLILVHIPKDLKSITAFSIPRDDYVPVSGIPGYNHAKIKEAYGLKKAAVEDKLIDQGVKDPVELEQKGREAGRESIVANVKALTGVPINRFAEISLVGFYDLANILGGVDVCLNHAVDDTYYSGSVFPAGRQHLDAANALSFVRQRHGLDNGDLDRTHRQQAFLTSVAKQLKDSGTLTDLGKLQALVDTAQNDIVLSQGWNLLDFAQTMGKTGSMPIQFRTLPIKGYDVIDDQDVNIVDIPSIRKTVRAAFGVRAPQSTTPKAMPTGIVDVLNAGAGTGVAGKVSAALAAKGFHTGHVGNANYSDGSTSVVYFGSGADTAAEQAADMLGGLPTAASSGVPDGHVRIVIGSDFTMPDGLTAADSATGSDSAASTDSSSSAADSETSSSSSTSVSTSANPNADSGKPVTTTIGSDIPCVN
ncbi:LCP family protein [Nocardia sp. NEAU-G5]|uniref:LCP family protein n=1 Tax=Nocardia albiluteola TaxID=2842303 RepID=A0ABS6B2F8_9NOCA|nr:LCP family protein [Nocardia albiluteola]MBU3064488.1 LCP family protein [Nocardia albiluteola]